MNKIDIDKESGFSDESGYGFGNCGGVGGSDNGGVGCGFASGDSMSPRNSLRIFDEFGASIFLGTNTGMVDTAGIACGWGNSDETGFDDGEESQNV